jgi:hypothetical protein
MFTFGSNFAKYVTFEIKTSHYEIITFLIVIYHYFYAYAIFLRKP